MTPPAEALARRVKRRSVPVRRSRRELKEWREKLISASKMSEDDLRARAENWELHDRERDIWETVKRIDWLLKKTSS